ncbi:Dabb family protein [Ammoniphilus sp. YIM 78166]|uniref:Dabb family protein n=1 Tax=Ammoniphilus sp. YIM 78166 TaxID=1644106 RepID=UPI00107044B3|nr:Dabb family protein [Ammoniphilus sp. YIM 78166]
MIDHVVIVKFSDSTTDEQMLEVCNKFKLLKGKIPGIIDVQAGRTFSVHHQGYQVMLTARFIDKASLENYGPHLEHRAVASFIREVGRVDSIVMDIEI